MKISVYIDYNLDNDLINIDKTQYGKYLILIKFKSLENYINFRRHIFLKKVFVDLLDAPKSLDSLLKKFKIKQEIFKKVFLKNKAKINVKFCPKENLEEIYNTKTPIILNLQDLTFEEKIELLTEPKIDNPNIFFEDEYTSGEYLTHKDMIEMYEQILYMSNEIKKKNYSPVEALYFIYSQIKERIYKKEKKRDKKFKSRSLNQIMKNDEIVCVGYSNFINAISDILKLNVSTIYWNPTSDKQNGHQENIVAINDRKYNIKGTFAIDATWDSKKNSSDDSHRTNIRHFLMPLSIDEKEKKLHNLEYPQDNLYFNILSSYIRLNKIRQYSAPLIIIENETKTLINKIKRLYEMLGINADYENMKVDDEINKIKRLGNQLIPLQTLENIIYTVEQKSEEDLEKTVSSSYHYLFASDIKKLIYILRREKK